MSGEEITPDLLAIRERAALSPWKKGVLEHFHLQEKVRAMGLGGSAAIFCLGPVGYEINEQCSDLFIIREQFAGADPEIIMGIDLNPIDKTTDRFLAQQGINFMICNYNDLAAELLVQGDENTIPNLVIGFNMPVFVAPNSPGLPLEAHLALVRNPKLRLVNGPAIDGIINWMWLMKNTQGLACFTFSDPISTQAVIDNAIRNGLDYGRDFQINQFEGQFIFTV